MKQPSLLLTKLSSWLCRELDIVISRDVPDDEETKESRSKTPNFEHSNTNSKNHFEHSNTNHYDTSNKRRESLSSKREMFEETGSLFSEQRVREEHRRIAQKLHNLGSSSSSLCDYRIRNNNSNNYGSSSVTGSSGSPIVPPKPYVSRTYIGGSASSSLAMKIHRKNLQSRNGSDPPLMSSLHGSLSSLHETR